MVGKYRHIGLGLRKNESARLHNSLVGVIYYNEEIVCCMRSQYMKSWTITMSFLSQQFSNYLLLLLINIMFICICCTSVILETLKIVMWQFTIYVAILGKSLEDIFAEHNCTFCRYEICCLGKQMLILSMRFI